MAPSGDARPVQMYQKFPCGCSWATTPKGLLLNPVPRYWVIKAACTDPEHVAMKN